MHSASLEARMLQKKRCVVIFGVSLKTSERHWRMAVAREIGAAHYMETSSKEGISLHEVFECAARDGL